MPIRSDLKIACSVYDFHHRAPQTDIKDTFESRELEASFCRDFSCCGLVLSDLHDLLQHYEECHVRLEDDEGSFYDDESSFWSPSSSVSGSVPSSPTLDDADVLKKKAAAYLSDLYNSTATTTHTTLSPLSLTAAAKEDAEDDTPTTKKSQGKKRSYAQYSGGAPSALDLLTQSAAKRLALATNGAEPHTILTDEDFLAQAGALLASANTSKLIKPCLIPWHDF